MVVAAGSNSRVIATGGGAHSVGWSALAQLAAAAALVVPVVVAMPSVELPSLTLPSVFDAATSTAPTSAASQTVAPGETPNGLTASEWADIQAQIAALDADPTAAGSDVTAIDSTLGAVTASSPGAADPSPWADEIPPVATSAAAPVALVDDGFTGRFAGDAVSISTRSASAAIETVGINGADVDGSAVHADGRVEIVRGAVTEWFRPTGAGLEQGWTVDRPIGDEIVLDVAVTEAVPRFVDATTARLERSDGSALWYAGLHAFDAGGAILPARLEVEGSTITIRVDPTGAVYPITIDPIISEDQQITGTAPGGGFGFALDLDGNRLVAAAPLASRGADGTGVVSVFVRDDATSNWQFGTTIDPGIGVSTERFGDAVAVRGDLVAVAESRRGTGATVPGTVRIYDVSSGDAVEVGAVSGTNEGDEFGASLAWLSDTRLVVGAPGAGAAAPGSPDDGAVFLVTDPGGGWVATPMDDGGTAPTGLAQLGYSVAAGQIGTREFVVAGAPGTDAAGADAGGVWVWDSAGADITTVAPTRVADDTIFVAGERAGQSVAFDVGRIAIGGVGAETAGDPYTIRVLDIVDPDTAPAEWEEYWRYSDELTEDLTASRNDFVDLVGGNVAIGRPGDGGQVWVFRDDGLGFGAGPADEFRHTDRTSPDSAGSSVAFDGRTLAMGAPRDDGDVGSVFTVEMVTMVNTFRAEAPAAVNWSGPANWDLGELPRTTDVALLPADEPGVSVDDDVEIAKIIVRSSVTTIPGRSLVVRDTEDLPNIIDGPVTVTEDTFVRFDDDTTVTAAGSITIEESFSSADGELVLDVGASVTGLGSLVNNGRLIAVNDASRLLDIDYSGTGVVDASAGGFRIDPNGFDLTSTTVRIGAGQLVRFDGDLALPNSAQLDLTVDLGAGSLPTLGVSGLFTPGGTIRLEAGASLDNTTADTPYPVISCGDCRGIGEFSNQSLAYFDLVQTPNAISLIDISNKVRGPDPGRNNFGTAVDIDGDWAVVGEPGDSGRAYVYERGATANSWILRQTLQLSDSGDPAVSAGSDGSFGTHVAIEGDIVAVTWPEAFPGTTLVYRRPDPSQPFAWSEDVGSEPTEGIVLRDGFLGMATLTDQINVYDLNGGPAVGVGTVGEGPNGDGTFALTGDFAADSGIVVVGNPPNTFVPGAGFVHVYVQQDGGSFAAPIFITDPDPDPDGFFGDDVALVDDRLVVADPLGDVLGEDAGQVWIYPRNGTTFGSPSLLTAPGGDVADQFGSSIDDDGEVLVVGAVAASKFDYPHRDGAAYTFVEIGGTWVPRTTTRAVDGFNGESYGADVAVSGGTILVGAPTDASSNGPSAGAVYVEAAPAPPGPAIVAIDGPWAAIGVPNDRLVYIVENQGGVWTDVQTITGVDPSDIALETPYLAVGDSSITEVTVYEQDPAGTFQFLGTIAGAAGSEYGHRLDIAAGRMAVGAPGNDDVALDAGLVIIYDLTTTPISQRVATVNYGATGDAPAAGDRFGAALSLTATDLWVGAPGDDGDGDAAIDSGAVRRYDVGGNYFNLTLRGTAAGAGFGSSIDAIPGRAAIGETTSTDVTVWDIGTGNSALPGPSTGFGNALAYAGDQLAVYDAGFSGVEIWSDDGQDGTLEYTGTTLPDVVDVVDDRHLDADGGNVIRGRLASDTTGWADTADITAVVAAAGIRAENPSSGDRFGADVAVDGDTMVVTAPGHDSPAGLDVGSAFVFERAGTSWNRVQSIEDASGAVALRGDALVLARDQSAVVFERSGPGTPFVEIGVRAVPATPRSIAIAGATLALGLPLASAGEGSVVVITGPPSDWVAGTAQTLAADPANDAVGTPDRFGWDVDVSADTLIVGAPISSSLAAPAAVDTYAEVWTRSDSESAFARLRTLRSGDTGDAFGWSVAAENNRVAVGMPTAVGQGRVYVYEGSTGVQTDAFGAATTLFGSAIDLDSGVLVIASSDAVVTRNLVGAAGGDALTIPAAEPGDLANGSGFVATSAGTVIVGAAGEDLLGADSGAAYAFEIELPTPGLVEAPDAAAGDYFGQSVAINENVMVVGARFGDGAVPDSGSAYVFRRALDTDEWTFETELFAADGATGDWFGQSVALAGSTIDVDDDAGSMVLAVGAPRATGSEVDDGAVYLFHYDLIDDSWVETGKIDGDVSGSAFGWSVAMEQRTIAFRNTGVNLVVGAPAVFGGTSSVALYRYSATADGPSATGTLDPRGVVTESVAGDQLGFAAAIDGGTVAVGARGAGVGGTANAGVIEVFDVSTGSLTPITTLTQPAGDIAENDFFPSSIAIDHGLIVAGGPFDNTVSPLFGAAYVFERIDGVWSSGVALPAGSLVGGLANFGVTVAVQNGVVAVAALEGGTDDLGSVTVYDRTSGTWAERAAYPWVRSATSAGGMGSALALSESGDLAIGFAEEGGVLPDAGAVLVIPVAITGPPNQLLPPGDGDVRFFGTSIDADGDWLIVSEPETAASRFDGAGRVHLFRNDGTAWQYHSELVDPDGVGSLVDRYGAQVALDGDWAAVTDVDDAVYTFRFDGSTWVAEASIPVTDAADGFSLSIDGDNARLIIGRVGGASIGSASIYDLVAGGSHVANTVITPADIVGADRYGARVAISGDRALVAADRDLGVPAGEPDSGSVRVLERSGTTWSQVEVLTDPTGAPGGRFGGSLDIDGDRAIVGSPTGAAATVVTFGPISTTRQRIAAPVGAGTFGIDVGIEGDVAVVGARRSIVDGRAAGSAYTYELTSSWSLVRMLTADDPEFADVFGDAVDITGDHALVSARFDDNDAGVFAGSVWSFSVEPPPTLELAFDIAPGQNRQVTVAPAGVTVAEFDAASVERNSETSIAAAPLSSIELEGTPLSSIPLSSTPLSSIATEPGSVLGRLSLIQVDIDGGWPAILEGTPLADLPLQQVTLADAFGDTSVGATLASTPLSSIDVNGTPLSSIPLSSIVLGTVPLSSIPLSSIDGFTGDPVADWCGIIGPFLPTGTTCDQAFLADFTLIEATLAGTPLSSIPLSSIPLSSIDVANTPLSSIPLSSIDFAATPLSSIPLSSIPLSSIDVDGTPLSSIPLSSIPLSSIPLSSIPLSSIPLSSIGPDATLANTPLSSIDVNGTPLSSIPLSSIPLSSIPLSSIPLSSIPLSSIPLSSIALGPLPLSSIPLSSIDNDTAWCDLLADLEIGVDCGHGVDPGSTTLTELTVRGVPLSSIPLSSIPLSSIDVTGTPLSSIPLSSIPLSSIPLSSIPLSSIPLSSIDLVGTPLSSIVISDTPLSSIPLSSIPLSSIDLVGSPLSSIPLSSIPLSSIPLSSIPLSSIPLSSIPLSSIPLSSIVIDGTPLSSIPLSSIDVIGSPLGSIPLSSIPLSSIDCARVDCDRDSLGDAVAERAITAGTTLGDIQPALSGVRLGDLADDLVTVTAEQLRVTIDGSPLTLSDLAPFDDLTLGEIAIALAGLDLQLGVLVDALDGVSFDDLLGALIDPTTGRPFGAAVVEPALRSLIDTLQLTYGDLDAVGDSTLGDLLAFNDTITLADVYPVLAFISVESMLLALGVTADPTGELVLGDLDPVELGNLLLLALFGNSPTFDALTVGQLLSELDAAGALEGFTLADLLLALVLTGDLTFGGFDFTDVDVAQLPESTLAPVSLATDFRLTSTTARTVEIRVELPASATYLPGTASLRSEFPAVTVDFEPEIGDNTITWTLDSATPGNGYRIEFEAKPTVQLGNSGLTARARVHGTDVQASAVTAIRVVEGLEPNDFTTPIETTPAVADTIYLTYLSSPDDIDVFEIELAENDILAAELSNLSEDFDLALWYRPDANGSSTGDPLSAVGDEAPLFPITDPDQTGADAEPLDDFPRLDEIDPSVQLVDVSNTAGTDDELILTDRLAGGTYYIEVFGQNGATSPDPAALQIQVDEAEVRPECVATDLPLSVSPSTRASTTDPDTNTVFVVNEQRLEQLHGAAGRADVMEGLDDLVTYLETNPGLGIDPAIIAVDSVQSVRDAYAAWDSTGGSCDPDAANGVVAAINAVIDPVRDQLTHVVLVGGDDVIPMARLDDATAVANEYDYRHEFNGDIPGGDGVNAFTASSWDRRYLSDEPYGETAARSLGNRFLYVSDIALGRLVESPGEIVQALDDFMAYEGSLDAQSATVLGYDFLVDGSERIADELAAGGLTVDDELADGLITDPTTSTDDRPWDRADAEASLADAGTNELISLNAHFDHYRALPAAGDKIPGFDDNLIATEVELLLGDDGFAQSLLFSMGCHSGLAVPNGSVALTNQDWAETVSRLGGIYIANTGFGYGDTETVAYTEALMALFSRYVVDPVSGAGVEPTTVGQALMFAKNAYVSRLGTMSVYDEKALMESTFYGLPFYQVGLTPSPLPAPPDNDPIADADGTPTVTSTIDSDHVLRSTDRGDYYANPGDDGDQTLIAPGRPIQPTTSTDVSVVDDTDPTTLTAIAHGAMVIGMTSTYVELANPVVATPVFDAEAQQPEPDLGDVNFPARPFAINTVTTPAGRRQQLVTATGQYRSKQRVQRLDDDIDTVVFYADRDVTDFERPKIRDVNAVLQNGILTVTLRSFDEAGVDRVHLLVAPDPGVGRTVDWVGLDLRPVGEVWSGSIDLGTDVDRTEFIVQAKDVNGNVGVSTNKATNYTEDEEPALPPVVSPTLAVEVDESNLDATAGWYTDDVTVTVRSTSPVLYRVDGGSPLSPIDGAFVITGDGVHTWTIENEQGATTSGVVRIDTSGEPTIVVNTPADGGVYAPGTLIDVRCADPSLQSCDITIDGEPVDDVDPVPPRTGSHTIEVVATDAFGNVATYTGNFEVRGSDPVIRSIDGPLLPLALADRVEITALFDDENGSADDYDATIDWGDGSSTTCSTGTSADCTVTNPTTTAPGSVVAGHTYSTSGIYSVAVTITDPSDGDDTEVFSFVVVYDAENGQVNGSGRYVSTPGSFPAGPDTDLDARFAFNAQYEPGDTAPSGHTHLKLGKKDLDFSSTAYDFLILTQTTAIAQGSGQVDKQDGFSFRVDAIDLGATDYFRIRIWNSATGETVYDNGTMVSVGSAVVTGDQITSGGGVKIRL